ncbi:hypothetical protein HYPSUDRAFT_40869 [Hypholoma sublateritium FD-334 SS-4]|uniref:EF-hand domain-containing protein n=1 Tax=Hypholoma sublateritium (strain FD-334 SS-4) TaxID=945553 RepID=A0A0D2P1A2_HYPSF|nr:hypothetical protein HYPSUDRAFT_40869 [Hypholoma sublateritium FD-334 SS-4]
MPSFHCTNSLSASDNEYDIATRILGGGSSTNRERTQTTTLSLEAAIRLFSECGLPLIQLREIWPVVDVDRKGYLSKEELSGALRLIGWSQAGHKPTVSLLSKEGPLPVLKGITSPTLEKPFVPSLSAPPSARASSADLQTSTQKIQHDQFGGNERYTQIFPLEGPVDGILDRRQVLEVFILQSSLSFRHLTRIYDLVDVEKRGGLDVQEFCLAMHIVEALDCSSVSTILPMFPVEAHASLQDLQASLQQPFLPSAIIRPSESHAQELCQMVSDSFQLTEDNSAPGTVNNSSRLSDAAELDLNFARLDIKQKGYVGSEVLSRFRWRYNIQPSEMTHIWNSVPGHDDAPPSEATIEKAIGLIRERLCSSHTAQLRIPRIPDRYARPASPASSEYSASTGDASSQHEDILTEIQALRAELRALDHKVSDTSQSQPSTQQQQHLATEIECFARTLAQKDAQHNEALAALAEAQAAAAKYQAEVNGLRELACTRINPNEHAAMDTNVSGRAGRPDMRALFLRAALRDARAETVRARAEIASLKCAVASRDARIAELLARSMDTPNHEELIFELGAAKEEEKRDIVERPLGYFPSARGVPCAKLSNSADANLHWFPAFTGHRTTGPDGPGSETNHCQCALKGFPAGEKSAKLSLSPLPPPPTPASHSEIISRPIPPPEYLATPHLGAYEPDRQPHSRRDAHVASPARKVGSPKETARVQEWFEQEVGRLLGKCENAEALARKAQAEIQARRQLVTDCYAAASEATATADNLRGVVKSQAQHIVQLRRRLA